MKALAAVRNRLKGWLMGPEGSWRGPFYGYGEQGGRSVFDPLEDGWQRNLGFTGDRDVSALQGAIAAHCNAFALMPVEHKRELPQGGFEVVKNSALARWLLKPNSFQTPAEFWANGIRELMESGNAVAFAVRNSRTEIVAAFWAQSWQTHIDPETGAIFYSLQPNDGTSIPDYIVPARDVLHLRINAPIYAPLYGRSPIQWCASTTCANAQLTSFLNSYLQNRASPSYVLTTDLQLNLDQIRQLRTAWDEQAARLKSGGTPVLASGLKPVQMGVAPGDALLVATFNLTVEDIARAFSMPRALLGISETASNAEQLLRVWISLGLGSLVEMVEQQIEKLFDLGPTNHVEFNSDALLRLDGEGLMRVAGEGVTKGILSPDEARARLGMAPIEGGFGSMPTMQQQQIPLDLLHSLHVAEIEAKAAPEPEPEPVPVAAEIEAEPEPVADEETARALSKVLWIEKKANVRRAAA